MRFHLLNSASTSGELYLSAKSAETQELSVLRECRKCLVSPAMKQGRMRLNRSSGPYGFPTFSGKTGLRYRICEWNENGYIQRA